MTYSLQKDIPYRNTFQVQLVIGRANEIVDSRVILPIYNSSNKRLIGMDNQLPSSRVVLYMYHIVLLNLEIIHFYRELFIAVNVLLSNCIHNCHDAITRARFTIILVSTMAKLLSCTSTLKF